MLGLDAQSYLTLCNPIDYSPPGSSVHGDSPGKDTGVGCHSLLQGIFLEIEPGFSLGSEIEPGFNLGSEIEPGSSTLQADSLPSEPTGKPSTCIALMEIKFELIKRGKGLILHTSRYHYKACVCDTVLREFTGYMGREDGRSEKIQGFLEEEAVSS